MFKTLAPGPLLGKGQRGLIEFKTAPCECVHVRQHFCCLPVHNRREPFLNQLPALKMSAVIAVRIHGLALDGFIALTGLFALGVAKEFQALPVGVSDYFRAGWDWFVAVAAVHRSALDNAGSS